MAIAVPAKVRIHLLDVIRGVAILGILAVNADGYAAPMLASLNPATWPFPNVGWTACSFWLIQTFFQEKFLTLFSMLFGVSLFLVGGERTDQAKSRILWRRLGVLFGFALLHGFGIWWGDILILYATVGLLMAWCRSWSPRTLLVAGLSLYLLMGVRQPLVAYFAAHPAARQVASASHLSPAARRALVVGLRAQASADQREATSSWAGAYRVNTREYGNVLRGYQWQLPATLGLMLVGLSLFKVGFLAGRSSPRVYWLSLAAGAVALMGVGWRTWQVDVAGISEGVSVAKLQYFLAPLVSLAYVSALSLLLRAGAGRVLAPFAAAGRMAFTNYLTQSLLMTTIFYGGRGALMGQVDRPTLWLVVFAVWGLQLFWSQRWLARFEMGPFEWLWRCLTYGHRVALRKPQ